MKLDLQKLVFSYGVQLDTVVHAGASFCQEAQLYEDAKIKRVLWIEADKDVAITASEVLLKFPQQKLSVATLYDKPNQQIRFNIASNKGESSSIFTMKFHKSYYKDIQEQSFKLLNTSTLDLVCDENRISNISLLVLDLQGAELKALMGGVKSLKMTSCIFTEVSSIQMYHEQPTFRDIHKFLTQLGFYLVEHDLINKKVMGEAIYVSKNLLDQNHLTPMDFPNKLPNVGFRRYIYYLLTKLGIPSRILRIPTMLKKGTHLRSGIL